MAIFLYGERKKLAEQELLYFAVWALTVIIFFSLFSQKRAVYILSAYPSIALLFGAWWYRLTSESAHAGFLTRLAGYFNAGSFVVLSALLIFQYTSQTPLSYLASGLRPKDKADLAHVAGLLMQHQTIVLIRAGICGIGYSILAVRKQAWVDLLQFRRLFSNVLRRTAYPSFRRTRPIALLYTHLAKRVGEY